MQDPPMVAGVLFNVLLTAFFIVTVLGVTLGVYAARKLKKAEDKGK